MLRRGSATQALFGVVLALCVPALVQAQQPLLPNATIHRHRVSCLQEHPEFTKYRKMYYGYYPTCWRTFSEISIMSSRFSARKTFAFSRPWPICSPS